MRWYRTLTPLQRRILVGLALLLVTTLSVLGWLVWSSTRNWQPPSPLPTVPYDLSPVDTPTASPTPSATPTPTCTPTRTPTPSPTPTPAFNPANAGIIAADIADARGIIPRWSTPLTLVNEYDLAVFLHNYYNATPPLPLQIRATLEALGLWFWDDVQVWLAPQADAAAALYIPEEDSIYLRTDWDGDLQTLLWQLAHGYARAIPEQYGNLPALRAEAATLDRKLALLAVAEGDALLALWLYAGVTPGSAEAYALQAQIEAAALPYWRPADPLLDDIARLPLTLGVPFAIAQYERGGLDALNAAVIRPPRSTEQLLHPERYLAGEEPLPLLGVTPPLGRDWSLIHTETVGQALLGLTFLEWSGGALQAEAAENWGGDLLQVWERPNGGRVVLWQLAWDSSREAARVHADLIDVLPRPLLAEIVQDTTSPALLPYGRWWAGEREAVFLRRYTDRLWLVWGDKTAVEIIGASLR